MDTVQTKPWSERYVGREPNHSSSDLHVILSVHLVKKHEINVLIQSEVDALRKDECLQLMEHLGEAQPRRGILVVELKSMIKDLLFSKGGGQEKPLLGFAKMNRNQLAEKARQLQIPVSENHTRGQLIKIIREDLIQQSTPKGSDYLGFGKHGAKTYQEVLHLDYNYCTWIEQVEDHQSHWKLEILVVAEDAKCISGTESGKQYGTRTDDMTHQTARGGKTIRRNASIERTRQKTQDSRTERSHLNYDLGGGEHRAEGTSQGVERTNTITDDVFARAWGGEFGRELCGMAETRGEKTMSALSTEEASWIENQVRHTTAGSAWEFLTEQTRVTLAEVGAHTGARMCNTVQELSERENAIKLGGTGNHLSDTTLGRQLAKTLEQKRPRHLWFSLRCGSYCTPVPTVHNKTYYLTKTDIT